VFSAGRRKTVRAAAPTIRAKREKTDTFLIVRLIHSCISCTSCTREQAKTGMNRNKSGENT
jgi:hypothetical protein